VRHSLPIISILFIIACSFSATAQLVITPNPVVLEEVDIEEFDVVAHSEIKNELPVVKQLVWVRNIIEITEDWESAICDKNACYLPIVSTMEFTLGPLEENILDVHVYPGGNDGYAIIEVIVTDKSDDENTVTGTYYFNRTVSSLTSERLTNNIKMFPNPASNRVYLEEAGKVHQVEIFNMKGDRVHYSLLSGGNQLDVSGLITGSYIIRMYDGKGTPVSSNVLQIK
jgi:hypothetical protein